MGGNSKTLVISLVSIAAIALIALGSVYFIFSSKLASTREELSLTKQALQTVQLNLNSLKANYETLKANYDKSRKANELLKKESASLNQSMKEIELQLDQSLDKLHDFDVRVRQSMEWFAANSNIRHSDAYNSTREKLNSTCIKTDANCYINLSCVYQVNYDNGIRYIEDTSSIRKEDFMLNLTQIDLFKGGDCEDFSLLFMAEYNYLFEECGSRGFGRENITTGTTDMEEKLTGQYMYVLCGLFHPRAIGNQLGGHCVNALTSSPIVASREVFGSMKHAVLVEPQTGEYMLHMNKTEDIKLFDQGMPPDTLYYVWLIITDADLKIFYEFSEKIEWVGYAELLQEGKKLNQTLRG
ncbi:hypothetical protein HYV81_01590 [Candidatus Woesearchaeota archaeon]|nr:hypothetical protein [Candidatus Woesearchaeota archaeon]